MYDPMKRWRPISGPGYARVKRGHDGSEEHRNAFDELSRKDGPAVIHSDGTAEWWIQDVHYTNKEEFRVKANLTSEEIFVYCLKYPQVWI